MSIKGTTQELFVGKKKSTIVTLFGKNKIVKYEDLKYINYMYSSGTEIGFLSFVNYDNRENRFEFGKNANEKISRTIDLIKENMPELEIHEQQVTDLKFYQRNLFTIIISFVLGFPLGTIGLYLMWHYKKSYIAGRILVTFMALLFWGTCGYISYLGYRSSMNSVNEAMVEYQNTMNNLYSGIQSGNQGEVLQTTPAEMLETNESTVSEVYNVGDVYESKEIKIMYLNSGDYNVENEYSQPESGNKFIFVEFSIENVGNSDCSVGYASFRCYADNTECSNPIVSSEGTMPVITSLSPERNTKGKIFYEVPTTAEKIEIEYETNIFTQEKIYFNFK